jgi:hypothetical protein
MTSAGSEQSVTTLWARDKRHAPRLDLVDTVADILWTGVMRAIPLGWLMGWLPLTLNAWLPLTKNTNFRLGLIFASMGVALASPLRAPLWNSKARYRLAGGCVRGLTSLAVFLAGSKHSESREEWASHLRGYAGHELATRQEMRYACGFVVAAIRYRLADVADATWTPVDAILRSRKLSNLLVFGPTVMVAVFILRHEGTLGVLKAAESILAIGTILYMLVRVGRWWRDVKPPEPPARRGKKQ